MTINSKEAEKMRKENFAILEQENEGLKDCVKRLGKNNEKLEQEYKQLEKEHAELIAKFNAITLGFREVNEKINELETILKMIG